MKKFVFLLVVFFAVLSLYAQDAPPPPQAFIRENPENLRETKIYVPPIDGIGSIEDMAYFFKQITAEITRQYRTLGRTRRTSDYVITGKIMPIAELEEEIEMPPDSEEDEYILFIELFNNETQEVIGVQYITYTVPDESTTDSLSVIIYNMVSGIPDLLEGIGFYDAWRNKRLYLNANFLWMPRIYIGTQQAANFSGVGPQIGVDYHFLSWLAVSASVEWQQEWVVFDADTDDFLMDMTLGFPLAAKFVFRPGENFMLEPYLGAQYNLSLLRNSRPFPISWLVGAELSIRLPFGLIVTIDPSFSMDFGQSYFVERPEYPYWRYSIHLGAGVKYGFFDRIKIEAD